MSREIKAYCFGLATLGTDSENLVNVHFMTRDYKIFELINTGQLSVQLPLKVTDFLCSICKTDYENCPHVAYEKYEGVECIPSAHRYDIVQPRILPRRLNPNSRITDVLLVTTYEDKGQYVWYAHNINSESIRLKNINKAYTKGWINEAAKNHFIQLFSISLVGVATFPPNPIYILEKNYRIDWIQKNLTRLTHKEASQYDCYNIDALYVRFQVEFDPERYENKTIDEIEYRYDKLDKIMVPYRETMEFFAKNMKGAPMSWIRPKIANIVNYIANRTAELEKQSSMDDENSYTPADYSERFLEDLRNKYKAKFVILNMDLMGSTKMSQNLTPQENAEIVRIFTQEMAKIVTNFHGFVLKYMGDGLIAYFPIQIFWGMDDNALDCAVTMKFMIEKGINPLFKKRHLPELRFRIGMDSGEAIVINVGDPSAKYHKDLIGWTINLATKIQTAADPNRIVVGETMLRNLGTYRRKLFEEFRSPEWDYKLENTQELYPLYRLVDVNLYEIKPETSKVL